MNLFTRFFSSLGKLAGGEINRGPYSGFSGGKEKKRTDRDSRCGEKSARSEKKAQRR